MCPKIVVNFGLTVKTISQSFSRVIINAMPSTVYVLRMLIRWSGRFPFFSYRRCGHRPNALTMPFSHGVICIRGQSLSPWLSDDHLHFKPCNNHTNWFRRRVKTPRILKGDFMQLLNIQDVADVMRISVSTVRRRVTDARKGKSSFVLPIHGKGKKCMWRADAVLMWNEDVPEVPHCSESASVKDTN